MPRPCAVATNYNGLETGTSTSSISTDRRACRGEAELRTEDVHTKEREGARGERKKTPTSRITVESVRAEVVCFSVAAWSCVAQAASGPAPLAP